MLHYKFEKRGYSTVVLKADKAESGYVVDDEFLRFVSHLPGQKKSQIERKIEKATSAIPATEVLGHGKPTGTTAHAPEPNITSPTDGVKERSTGGKQTDGGDDRQSRLMEQEMLRRLANAQLGNAYQPGAFASTLPSGKLDPLARLYLKYEPYIRHGRYANG